MLSQALFTTLHKYHSNVAIQAINVAIEGVLEHHFKLEIDKKKAQNQQARSETQKYCVKLLANI